VNVNKSSFKNVSLLLGLAASIIACNPLSASAETPIEQPELASTSVFETTPTATTKPAAIQTTDNFNRPETVAPNATGTAIINQLENVPTVKTSAAKTAIEIPVPPANLADARQVPVKSQPASPVTVEAQDLTTPQPEKLETSAASLKGVPTANATTPATQSDTNVAQNVEVIPGRATRGGSSYIGIGGNLGLSGDPALGDGAFVVNSKIGLTRNISFRPAVVFGDDTDFLLPLTYDFVLESADPFAPIPFAPYLGGGVIVSTNGDNTLGFLLTGGVDVPLSSQFVANASINVGFRNSTDIGLMLGVGYTFPGFSR
jgi:hypothetical protein